MEIYYWKNEQQEEVDFVIKENTKVANAIQVCSDISDITTKKRELRSLGKAMETFGLENGLVITEDVEGEEIVAGKKIHYVPLWKWLLKI
jgi:hypothetical protein